MSWGVLSAVRSLLQWAALLQFTLAIQMSPSSSIVPAANQSIELVSSNVSAANHSIELVNSKPNEPLTQQSAQHDDDFDQVWVNFESMNDIQKIPVFAFDKEAHGHMQAMVLDWGKLYELNIDVALYAVLGVDPIRKAFQFIRKTKPKMALWLLPFRNGDPNHVLPELADFFEVSHHDTRHGVFHWPPEMCDEHDCTVKAVQDAYRYAEFVFQFGYQDERLSRLNPEKYLPWPLGPAWWKGWKTPILLNPISRRPILAAFRGALNTHEEIEDMKRIVHGIKDVVVEDSGKWIGNDNATSAQRYQELLSTSKFAINLAGRNPNCYRVFEAVLSGAIPILFVKSGKYDCYDNWAAVYGNPIHTAWKWIPKSPFEILESMEELPTRLKKISDSAVDERGPELDIWYTTWRQSFRYKLVQRLAAALSH